jgi:multidrug efflux pump subunit AcrB
VENGIVLAVEEAVRGVDGIKKITSTASESLGSVVAELEADADKRKVADEIESEVDRITSFPVDVERPVVNQASNRREVLTVVVAAELDEWSLRNLGEDLRDELLTDERVTIVDLSAVRPYEISIEIPQETLRRFDLTLSEVAAKVRAASVELPGGGVKTKNGEILVRVDERRDVGSEFRAIVLRENDAGAELRLGDVAEIQDGFQDIDVFAYFNGKPAVLLKVFRVGDQTPIDVSDAAREFVERKKAELPPNVELHTWGDSSEAYRGRVDLLRRNAMTGLILVIFILGLFLDLRLSFWITLGIPISFCGALLFLPHFDVSLNLVSLFGFILTLGVVVDDAIVVGESIYKKREDGLPPMRAAIEGALEVAGPVTFSVLTTIIAFMPLLFVPGVMGKIMRVLPLVVVAILSLSLIESMFILPAHLAHTKLNEPRGLIGAIYRIQRRFADALQTFIESWYEPALRRMLLWRYVTLAVATVALIGTFGLVAGKRIDFIFLPRIESEVVIANAVLPFGSNVDRTSEVSRQMTESARTTIDHYGGEQVTRGVLTLVGAASVGGHATGRGAVLGSHLAQVAVFLVPEDKRDFGSGHFSRKWRDTLGPVPGLESLKFKSTNGPSGGADIDVELIHRDTQTLELAGQDLGRTLAGFDGVEDIDDGFAPGKPQLNLRLTRQGRAWGFSEMDLARAVRSSFFGQEALRQQRGRDEVRTYVRLPDAERTSEQDIRGLLLLTPGGGEIPLEEAARVARGHSYKQIKRRDGQRVLNVTAEVDEERNNASRILGDLAKNALPDLLQRFPGLSYRFSGAQESRAESMAALKSNFSLALVAMFALMAVAFGSYSQPLLIMLTIPFGIVGAIWGHMVMGMPISLMSMFGVVALAGVVVNDSLVLISAMNTHLAQNECPLEAVVHGATRRFRPILLTSLTTFLGLMPMLTETSLQARFLIPMAVSLGIGVMFATLITLVIIPAAYLVLEDIRNLIGTLGRYVFAAPPQKGG